MLDKATCKELVLYLYECGDVFPTAGSILQ